MQASETTQIVPVVFRASHTASSNKLRCHLTYLPLGKPLVDYNPTAAQAKLDLQNLNVTKDATFVPDVMRIRRQNQDKTATTRVVLLDKTRTQYKVLQIAENGKRDRRHGSDISMR